MKRDNQVIIVYGDSFSDMSPHVRSERAREIMERAMRVNRPRPMPRLAPEDYEPPKKSSWLKRVWLTVRRWAGR